jgi:hypothetical protein
MKYFLSIIFCIFAVAPSIAQTVPNEVRAKRVVADIFIRPSKDTVARGRTVDNGGIAYKDGVHYYWNNNKYSPLYNPDAIIEDSLKLVHVGVSGLNLHWTNESGDILYTKKLRSSTTIDLIQDQDSSIVFQLSPATYTSIRKIDNINFTVLSTDHTMLVVNNDVSVRECTLPDPVLFLGRHIRIINSGSQSINTTRALRKTTSSIVSSVAANTTVDLTSDGSSWWIVGIYSR